MAIVAGFDVHRAHITFDALDTETGEVTRGRIDSAPAAAARWVARFAGREVHVAVEACTGLLFVCDALAAAGVTPHLAEPVETRARALRGRKRRAKTDREDARWLRELLADGRQPEAWIPPEHVRQWRSRARMRHTLPHRRAHRVDAAHPSDAVSPRHRRDARQAAHARGPRVPRAPRDPSGRARADPGRAGDGRRDRRADRPARARAAPARPPPDRLQGPDAPLRHGRAHLAGHAVRTR